MRSIWKILAFAGLAVAAAGCSEEVTKPPVTNLSVDSLALVPDSAEVKVGASFAFTLIAYDSIGLQIVPTPAIQFVSSDPLIMTVNNQGRVFGQRVGQARLYASAGNGRDTAYVTVAPGDTGWISGVVPGVTNHLRGVYFLDNGISGWVVGDNGRILFTESGGEIWGTQTSNTISNLQSVWFTGAMDGWAVGLSGTILRTTNGGANWSRIGNPNASENLNDVEFITPDVGFVVGDRGVILKTTNRGTTWQRTVPTTGDLFSVSFAGSNGWAVGENGVILGTRDAGETWTTVQPSVAVQPLRSVSRASVRHAVAVGDLGNAPYSVESGDSALWVVNNVGGTNNLRGVSFPTEDVGYAVGSNVNGVILRSIDGGLTWQSQTPNTASQLNAVFFINENRGWAVGNNGVILRTASGGAATSSFAHRAAQRAVRRR